MSPTSLRGIKPIAPQDIKNILVLILGHQRTAQEQNILGAQGFNVA
jgi:hypothetical protein